MAIKNGDIMHRIFLLILIILVCGCKNEPKRDEIYENKLSKERINVDRVGIGRELRDFYEGINAKIKDISSDPALGLLVLRVPIINDDDTLKQCIAYEEKGYISAGSGKVWKFQENEYDEVSVTYAKIISIEQLEKDYIKIE